MTKFSTEVEAEIRRHSERRESEMTQIEGLWSKLCRLRGIQPDFEVLDRQIMNWFETTSGRDSLAFESIEKVKSSLNKAIKKEMEHGTGVS